MTERRLRKQVEKYLKSIPSLWFYHPADRWIVGLPDFIICYRGRFYAIELKKKGERPRKIQRYIIAKIKEAKGCAIVAYTLEDVKEVIKNG